jgi:hypothetical protein
MSKVVRAEKVEKESLERELTPIPFGTRVRLRGLRTKPELNGQPGIIIGYDVDLMRCKVGMLVPDGESGKSKTKAVNAKPDNLEVVERGEDEEGEAGESPLAGGKVWIPPKDVADEAAQKVERMISEMTQGKIDQAATRIRRRRRMLKRRPRHASPEQWRRR